MTTKYGATADHLEGLTTTSFTYGEIVDNSFNYNNSNNDNSSYNEKLVNGSQIELNAIGNSDDDKRTLGIGLVVKRCTLVAIFLRPEARYGLPPPRGNFVDYDFLEASCLAGFLQHVSPLAMEALPSNSPLHMLPIQRLKFNI